MFSGHAFDRVNESDIDKIFVTDTINFNESASNKIIKISAAPLFGEAIKRTFNNESISSLFNIDKG
jgi:ribose-phosphate pyrophosphokinase